jgi:hypothetical protein
MSASTAPLPSPPSLARRRRNSQLLAALAALALGASVAACGDDGDDGTAAEPTTTEVAAEAQEETADPVGERPALCDAWLRTDEAGSDLGDPDAPPEVAQEATQGIAEALEGVEAPDGLDEQLAVANAAVEAALAGDPSAFQAPDFTAAITDLAAWVHEDCGFAQVEVDAVDHAFEGLDEPLAVGPTSFRLANGGADAHVMVIHRFDDASELSAEELVEAMEPAGSTALEDETVPVVTGAFAAPGGEGYITSDLEAGRYVVFCPIPAGFTGDGPPPADAPPHLALGMFAEFTVG